MVCFPISKSKKLDVPSLKMCTPGYTPCILVICYFDLIRSLERIGHIDLFKYNFMTVFILAAKSNNCRFWSPLNVAFETVVILFVLRSKYVRCSKPTNAKSSMIEIELEYKQDFSLEYIRMYSINTILIF